MMAKRGLVERTCELQSAMGFPVRMKMIKVLGSHQEAPLSVSEVAEKLQISQPTATKHLAILREAGWITREQVAREVHYRLNLDTVAEFRMLIDLGPPPNSCGSRTCGHGRGRDRKRVNISGNFGA